MILLVGLGNPGEKYKKTRHNVGFLAIDVIATKFQVDKFEIRKKHYALIAKVGNLLLLKPQTFMNSSGKSVKKIVDQYKIETPNLWVIHDDLDIKIGSYKIQKGRGPKDHKGIESVEKSLGKDDFWRVRVGVENRHEDDRISGEDYVLQNFNVEEIRIIEKTIDKTVEELESKLR